MKFKIIWLLFALMICITNSSYTLSTTSPLAKLMREMLAFLDKEKDNVEKKLPAQPFPKSFEKIKTARLTPGKRPSSDHEAYITSFQTSLDEYYSSVNGQQRQSKFNALVNTCIQCHQRECPGPVQRIEKNLMP